MHRTQDDERTGAPRQRAADEAHGLPEQGRRSGAVVVDVGCEACGARATLSPQESLAWFGVHPYGCGAGDSPR